MLDMGIYLPPSQYECCFFSLALSDSDIKKFLMANKNCSSKNLIMDLFFWIPSMELKPLGPPVLLRDKQEEYYLRIKSLNSSIHLVI